MFVSTLRSSAILVFVSLGIESRVCGQQIASQESPAPAAKTEVEQALDKVISVKFDEKPLSEVIEFFRKELNLEIQVDKKSLDDAGIDIDTPVTRQMSGLKARSVLRLVLGGFDLSYGTDNGILLITTPDALALSPREKVEKALNKVISVNFVEMPLSNVIEHLRKELNLEIQLDRKALADSAASSDTPINCNLHDITARSILRLMFRALDLTYVTEDEVLVITTSDVAAKKLRTVVYPVDDLIGGTNAFGEPTSNYASLMNVLENTINLDSWDQVGGNGSVMPLDGKLVISQRDDIHEQIAGFLAAARQLKELPSDAALPAPIHIGRSDSPATLAVRKALQQTLPLEFTETPLTDVCAFLRNQLKIEVQLDTKALEFSAIAFETPVTFKSKTASLGTALRLMLRDLDLTYITKDEVLLITTIEKAGTELNLVAFPIHDFVTASPDPFAVFQKLLNLVTTSVQNDRWDEVGGVCSITPVRTANAFLVLGDEQVLADVEELFKNLRLAPTKNANIVAAPKLQIRMYRVLRQEPQPTPAREVDKPKPAEARKDVQPQRLGAGHAPSSPTTVFISAAGQPTIDEIIAMIQEFVEPESWKKGDAYIRVFGDQLMIRQTPTIHRRIDELLNALGLGGFQGAPGC